jgi:hypothetical protein
MFFVAFTFAGVIPTPGAWSDSRSEWLPAIAVMFSALIFLFATHLTYWRGGPLTRVQAWLLSIIFGAVFVMVMPSLYESILFMREVARHNSPNQALETNSR